MSAWQWALCLLLISFRAGFCWNALVTEQLMARPAALQEKLVGNGAEDLAALPSALVTKHVSCVRFTCVLLWGKLNACRKKDIIQVSWKLPPDD